MANFAKQFQDEIRRLARKETKDEMQKLRVENADLRKQIGQMRQRMDSIERLSKRAARTTEKVAARVSESTEEETTRARVSAKTIRTMRERLRLTQGEMGQLLGVSGQSIYQWERKEGRLNLRSRTARAVLEMKSIGAREARRRLENGR